MSDHLSPAHKHGELSAACHVRLKSKLWPPMTMHNLVCTTSSFDITACSREAVWVHALPHRGHIKAHGWCHLLLAAFSASPGWRSSTQSAPGGTDDLHHTDSFMDPICHARVQIPWGGKEVGRIKNSFSPLPISLISYFFPAHFSEAKKSFLQ